MNSLRFYDSVLIFGVLFCMKNVVLQDILAVVDDQVFSSPDAAKSLKKTLSGYKRGTLRQILGEDTSDALYGFADDLVDLGDVGEGFQGFEVGGARTEELHCLFLVVLRYFEG